MTKVQVALLLAGCSTSLHAQVPQKERIQPNIDSAESRLALQNLTACLAKARPRWARQTLSQAYLGDEQARVASQALTGKDSCLGREDSDVIFRTSGIAGGLAEYFLRTEIAGLDLALVSDRMSAITPMNASEDFALCVAARNPSAARDLALSVIGSTGEAQAARQLAGDAGTCVNKGAQLTVDVQSLRALMATALYRGVTAVRTARTASKS